MLKIQEIQEYKILTPKKRSSLFSLSRNIAEYN